MVYYCLRLPAQERPLTRIQNFRSNAELSGTCGIVIVRNQISPVWRLATQFLLGCVGLAALTLVCFRLQLNLASVAFGYLIVIVLLALMGSVVSSVILSIIAAGCLTYFFAPPIFDFRIDDPLDVLAVIGFLTASLLVAGLVERVRRLNEQFQLVVDNIPAMVWSKEPDGSADFLNQYFQEYTGISAEEARGWGWMNAFHPDDRAMDEWREALAAGEPFRKEARLRGSDGQYRWFALRAMPLRDQRGNIVKWYGTTTDIDDRKQVETRVRQAERELRLAIDTIPALVWTTLPDGSLDFINQRWAEIGLSLRDLRGSKWAAVIHPEEIAGVMEKWNAAVASGQLYENVERVRGADGEYRWFLSRAAPLRDESGKIVKWYGTDIDIEDRRRAEDALRESEQRFRDYAETASDWLWETGPDHCFTRVSEHPDAMGLSPPRRIGMTRWDLATDLESEPEKWRLHRALLDAHQPFRDFVYSATRDGSALYVQTSGKPVFDAKGNFLGYRGVSTDVTAAIRADQAEEELRKVQKDLSHVTRLTTLGELTASISHEVNQPLTAIVTNGNACLRWLSRDVPPLDEVRSAVELMISEGNRAAEVIQRVRALANKVEVAKVLLPVNAVIEEVILLLHHEMLSHRILLRLELASELPLVLADRIQLQQVIINLVMNGMEAMATVTDRPRELKILSQRQADQVFVAVQDAGVGIDPAHLDRLFKSFFTTKPGGMGMGLSICRSIIEAQGGELWASSNAGAGATFQFTLPAHQEAA
jgi:PAS domain S-box-containing protein